MPPYQDFKRSGVWKRFLVGAFIVIAATAGSTTVAAFEEIDKVVQVFERGRGGLDIDKEIAEAASGKPQTIMIVGSDRRSKDSDDVKRGITGGARSDTIILVRLDPSRKATALMSLPRDLKVDIPGHGTAKINEAYSEGGIRLTVRTVKQLTGLRINHVVNIDFKGFRRAVNAIGCVYVDVDRRYFNDNMHGGELYATIDVQPGYQRVCGQDALDYVRFRHEDTDIVRSARQQDFLRQAKAQIGIRKLIENRDELFEIFADNTQSDINGRKEVLSLIKLALASAKHPIREVHFEGEIGASYVTASSAKVRKLTKQFLGVEETKGPRGGNIFEKKKKRRKRGQKEDIRISDFTAAGKQQAVTVVGKRVRMPVYYPTKLARGSQFVTREDSAPRVYKLETGAGTRFSAYRMVVASGLTGQYYGLQGTTWRNPPILRGPVEKRKMRGRKFELHYDGDRLRLVAWRTKRGSYWISNTLLQTLTEKQMLAIAASTKTL